MKSTSDAVSQVIGVLVMIALVSVFAIVIYSSVFGLTPTIVQPPYIAIESELHDPDGTPYIELRHKGEDTISLNTTGAEQGKVLDLFVSVQGQTVRAVPLAPMNWRPGGEHLLVQYTGRTPAHKGQGGCNQLRYWLRSWRAIDHCSGYDIPAARIYGADDRKGHVA